MATKINHAPIGCGHGDRPTFDFDIYADIRIGEDVQGDYARTLADAPPVFWTPANGGHWVVTGYEEIVEVVSNPQDFSAREMQIPRVPDPPQYLPLSLDPPDNMPYRQILMPAFSPKAVREMEPELRRWAIELLDEVTTGRTSCDFVHDVASRYPVTIFMRLMGMPIERLREFRSIADEHFMARTPEDFAAVVPKINALVDEQIALREREPGDDLVSQLLRAQMKGRKLSHLEIQRMCFLLFLGGMDTVTNVSGFAYQALAKAPQIQARLVADPDLIPAFVEESLRLYGVVSTPRVVARETVRFGVRLEPGEMVLAVLAMGGRDERANPHANDFDLDRQARKLLAFSSGPHLCIGHVLARAEMRVLTEEWLRRVPSFRAKPGVAHLFRLGTVNALETLPLEWG